MPSVNNEQQQMEYEDTLSRLVTAEEKIQKLEE